MADDRRTRFTGRPLEVVADAMAGCDAGSPTDQMARAEFLLRQTAAQVSAAEAARVTAEQTGRYARYVLWSVVILAGSMLGTLIVEYLKFR